VDYVRVDHGGARISVTQQLRGRLTPYGDSL